MTRQNAPLSIKGAAGSNPARPLRSRTPPPNGSAPLRTRSDRLITLTSEDEQSAATSPVLDMLSGQATHTATWPNSREMAKKIRFLQGSSAASSPVGRGLVAR
jgi:hypothetical protein